MKTLKNSILNLVICLTLFISFHFIPLQRVSAQGLTTVTDEMTRINTNITATHVIKFVTITGVSAGQTITVTFPSDFSFGTSYNNTDMGLAVGSSSNCSTATFSNLTLASSPSGTTWGAAYATSVVTFTSGTGTISGNLCVKVTLNSNGVNHTITNPNPVTDTVYNINVTAGAADSGQLAVIILKDAGAPDSDQVQINATIADSISLDVDVSTTNCNNSTETSGTNNNVPFGLLIPTVAKYSGAAINFICLDTSTNHSSGLTLKVQDSRNNSVGGLVSGSNAIVSASANLNLAGTLSGYGLRISSLGTPAFGSLTVSAPFNSVTAGDIGIIPGALGTAASIVTSAAPVQTGASSRVGIEVGVKADTSTPQGSYSDTLTFTGFTNL